MLNQFAVEIPTLPVDQCHSPPHPIPEGMLCRSFGVPSRREGAAKHLGHTWYIGKRFLKIQMRHHQHLIRRNCINEIHRSKSHSIRPQWRKVKGKHKIKIRHASLGRQSSSVEEILQRIMEQTNNDCRFRIFISTHSLHQLLLLAGR